MLLSLRTLSDDRDVPAGGKRYEVDVGAQIEPGVCIIGTVFPSLDLPDPVNICRNKLFTRKPTTFEVAGTTIPLPHLWNEAYISIEKHVAHVKLETPIPFAQTMLDNWPHKWQIMGPGFRIDMHAPTVLANNHFTFRVRDQTITSARGILYVPPRLPAPNLSTLLNQILSENAVTADSDTCLISTREIRCENLPFTRHAREAIWTSGPMIDTVGKLRFGCSGQNSPAGYADALSHALNAGTFDKPQLLQIGNKVHRIPVGRFSPTLPGRSQKGRVDLSLAPQLAWLLGYSGTRDRRSVERDLHDRIPPLQAAYTVQSHGGRLCISTRASQQRFTLTRTETHLRFQCELQPGTIVKIQGDTTTLYTIVTSCVLGSSSVPHFGSPLKGTVEVEFGEVAPVTLGFSGETGYRLGAQGHVMLHQPSTFLPSHTDPLRMRTTDVTLFVNGKKRQTLTVHTPPVDCLTRTRIDLPDLSRFGEIATLGIVTSNNVLGDAPQLDGVSV